MPIENVKKIGTVSKIEYFPKVSSDFNNVDTIASISYSDEKGKYHKEDIVGIDFQSCLVETVSGDIYSVDNMSELQKNAEQLNIEVPQNIPQIEIIQMQRNNGQSVMIDGDQLILTKEGNQEYFKITNMYYNIKYDVDKNIISEEIKDREVEATTADDRRKIDLAREYIETSGDENLKLPKTVTMSFSLEAEDGSIKLMRFNDVEYPDLQNLTGFDNPVVDNPDKELHLKLAQMKEEIVTANDNHIQLFNDDKFQFNKMENFQIENNNITCDIDGKKRKINLSDIDANISNRGLEIEYGGTSYMVTSIDEKCTLKNPQKIFNKICDGKKVERVTEIQDDNTNSKIIQAVDSLSAGIQYSWDTDGKSPNISYSIAGQKISESRLQDTVYASIDNGLLAVRSGDSIKILYSKENELAESTAQYSVTKTDDGFELVHEGKKLQIDYLDGAKKIAIADGQVYKCNFESKLLKDMNRDNNLQYINNSTNEIKEFLEQYCSTANNVVNNWDITSKKDSLFLVENREVDGKIESREIKQIKMLSMDKNGVLRAQLETGFATLGAPSTTPTASSIYKVGDNTLSMSEAIQSSGRGINSVMDQVNSLCKEEAYFKEIPNPKEIIRDAPDKCFVVLKDNDGSKELYYKEGDNLFSKDEKPISFSDNRLNVSEVFTTDRMTEIKLLRELSQNEVHLKETIDSDKHLFTNGDKDIIVDTTASYHKSFAIDDDVAKDEMKGMEKETDLAID